MRGENLPAHLPVRRTSGSPPHARGKRRFRLRRPPHARITPACAVKTAIIFDASDSYSDHPRMRGENDGWLDNQPKITGSPPHARGKRRLARQPAEDHRITPACAGKTPCSHGSPCTTGDHPRMRGENDGWLDNQPKITGSPPHARGKLPRSLPTWKDRGITPACAGKTGGQVWRDIRDWDHPRMRGEDLPFRNFLMHFFGSPPHARGRPVGGCAFLRDLRITPACAGKT